MIYNAHVSSGHLKGNTCLSILLSVSNLLTNFQSTLRCFLCPCDYKVEADSFKWHGITARIEGNKVNGHLPWPCTLNHGAHLKHTATLGMTICFLHAFWYLSKHTKFKNVNSKTPIWKARITLITQVISHQKTWSNLNANKSYIIQTTIAV